MFGTKNWDKSMSHKAQRISYNGWTNLCFSHVSWMLSWRRTAVHSLLITIRLSTGHINFSNSRTLALQHLTRSITPNLSNFNKSCVKFVFNIFALMPNVPKTIKTTLIFFTQQLYRNLLVIWRLINTFWTIQTIKWTR